MKYRNETGQEAGICTRTVSFTGRDAARYTTILKLVSTAGIAPATSAFAERRSNLSELRGRFRKMQIGGMNQRDLQEKTKRFALQISEFWESLPRDETCKTLGRQLIRAGTSVGANYRAVCRAKSKADFISKLGIVLEEVDESAFWIVLLLDSEKVTRGQADPLLSEANQLVAIAISSINTARSRKEQSQE